MMSFRVTPHRQYELGQSRSQARYAQGAVIQEQMSTGFRVNRPSDDPAGQKVILNQSTLVQQLSTQLTSISTARNILSDAQTQVLDAQQMLVKAKDIALQARQTTEPAEKGVFVQQLDSILQQLNSIANSQSNGQYLFAGIQTEQPPFSGITEGEPSYQGSGQNASISLPGQPDIRTYYSGNSVFQPATGGPLVISGSTGIAPAAGTSSGSATTTLSIQHVLTTYSGGSGIQAGIESPGQDTVLGPLGANTLTIHDTAGDGSAGTISLNGGPPVSFTSADGNLQVTGPNGEQVFVSTQSITAGFNGTVDIAASGTMSIDGGATQVPIDFSTSQTLTSQNPAVVQHFNTTQLRTTGTVTVAPAASADVFQAVISLKETIENTRGLTAAEQDAAYDRSLANLDAAGDHLLKIIGAQSVDLEHLETLQSRFETLQLNAKTILSETQATDYATALTQFQEQQNLLQFTLQTVTTMNSISILDFL